LKSLSGTSLVAIARPFLLVGAAFSFAIASLHVTVAIIGTRAYRYFGAPETLVLAASKGSPAPAAFTILIAAVFVIWGAYALSGAGTIRRLPLLRTALVLISVVYVLRGLSVIPQIALLGQTSPSGATVLPRHVVFSTVSLVAGFLYAIGVVLLIRSDRVDAGSRDPRNPLGGD